MAPLIAQNFVLRPREIRTPGVRHLQTAMLLLDFIDEFSPGTLVFSNSNSSARAFAGASSMNRDNLSRVNKKFLPLLRRSLNCDMLLKFVVCCTNFDEQFSEFH